MTEFSGAPASRQDALPKSELTLVRDTPAPVQPHATEQHANSQKQLALIAAMSEEEKIALFS